MKTTNKHKRITKFVSGVLIGTLVVSFLHCSFYSTSMATIMPSAGGATNNNQKIIQEVAKAFYLKGDAIQYESQRRNQFVTPENLTSQSPSYMVCSSFTYATYYNAFGIVTPQTTARINAYGKSFYNQPGHDDVVMFKNGEELQALANESGRESFKNELLAQLQIGDLVTYYDSVSSQGHVTLVYDFEYDNQGQKTDAIILHSTSNFTKATNKLTDGLSWYDAAPNPITGVDEGTVQYTKLTNVVRWATSNKDFFTLYRPLAISQDNNLRYNRVSCNGSSINNMVCDSELATFEQKPTSLARLNYPGIQIEKTVDVFNGSVVEPGDTLTYDIAITNNSNSAYQNVSIVENIPADLVTANGGASQLSWTVDTIAPGTTHHQQYTVTVKNDSHLSGQHIISTGSVVGIPSAKVTNTIGNNLTSEEKSSIVSAYNNLKNTYSGVELVDQIYTSALGLNLGLKNTKLGTHHNIESNTATTKRNNIACNPYFESEDSGPLLRSQSGGYVGRNEILNKEHPLAEMILNNYYSSLYFVYSDDTTCNVTSANQKFWNQYEDDPAIAERSERSERIYPETLQTGDILFYANTGTTKQGSDPVTHENGSYAFIWIEDSRGGNFYGVNSLANDTALDVISGVNDKSANNLQTIFGKDYYVILRPSLSMVEDESEDPVIDPDNTKPDDRPVDESNVKIDDFGAKEPTVPDTGSGGVSQDNGLKESLITAGLTIGVVLIYLFAKTRKSTRKVNFK